MCSLLRERKETTDHLGEEGIISQQKQQKDHKWQGTRKVPDSRWSLGPRRKLLLQTVKWAMWEEEHWEGKWGHRDGKRWVI